MIYYQPPNDDWAWLRLMVGIVGAAIILRLTT